MVAIARGGAEKDGAAQPCVGTVAGDVEPGGGAEIIEGGIDGFALRNAGQHRGGAMAIARVGDGEDRAVACRYGIAGEDVGCAVGPDGLPVRAAGQYPAGQARAVHRAAGDGNDALAHAIHHAQFLRRADQHAQAHGESQRGRGQRCRWRGGQRRRCAREGKSGHGLEQGAAMQGVSHSSPPSA